MKVFLSHSSLDKKLVRSVGEEFCIRNCCFDEIDIEKGEDIPEKVNEGLKQCTHFILFWSKNIANSSWVSSELNASFVLKIKCLCKIFIFTLDNYPLPQLIEPFKYDKIPYVEDISQKKYRKTNNFNCKQSSE